MTNFSRRYYERELGAGIAPSPSMKEHFGYTEPFRRFVQRENFSPQANPLRNEMPGWLPGADYLTNFHIGDPYTKVDEGYARLPGAGYEALHPELKGVDPRDYPDINKLAILADVAPYSSEYNIFRSKVGADSADNTGLRIEYEKILDRVRQTRESVIRMDNQVSPSCQPKNASRGRAGRAGRTHRPTRCIQTGAAPPVDPPAPKLSFRFLRSAPPDQLLFGSRVPFFGLGRTVFQAPFEGSELIRDCVPEVATD